MGGALTPCSNQYTPNPKLIGFISFVPLSVKKKVYSAFLNKVGNPPTPYLVYLQNDANANVSEEQTFLVVVAIDFGTTSSGYAYSFTKEPECIHVMRWALWAEGMPLHLRRLGGGPWGRGEGLVQGAGERHLVGMSWILTRLGPHSLCHFGQAASAPWAVKVPVSL